MKDKFSTEWTEVVKTTDANPEAEVLNLREKMTYQFRVIAVNKAGPSVPSEPTNTHVCKHKNRKFFFSLIDVQWSYSFGLTKDKYNIVFIFRS